MEMSGFQVGVTHVEADPQRLGERGASAPWLKRTPTP